MPNEKICTKVHFERFITTSLHMEYRPTLRKILYGRLVSRVGLRNVQPLNTFQGVAPQHFIRLFEAIGLFFISFYKILFHGVGHIRIIRISQIIYYAFWPKANGYFPWFFMFRPNLIGRDIIITLMPWFYVLRTLQKEIKKFETKFAKSEKHKLVFDYPEQRFLALKLFKKKSKKSWKFAYRALSHKKKQIFLFLGMKFQFLSRKVLFLLLTWKGCDKFPFSLFKDIFPIIPFIFRSFF